MTAATAFKDVEVLEDFILFQFMDEVDHNNKNAFRETTEAGIILKSNYQRSTTQPRWVTVIATGPKVTSDVVVGSRVLVQALKWTRISKYNGENFARTEMKYVLAVEE